MFRVTGPVTSSASACRGEATSRAPYRSASYTGPNAAPISTSHPLHEPASTCRICTEPPSAVRGGGPFGGRARRARLGDPAGLADLAPQAGHIGPLERERVRTCGGRRAARPAATARRPGWIGPHPGAARSADRSASRAPTIPHGTRRPGVPGAARPRKSATAELDTARVFRPVTWPAAPDSPPTALVTAIVARSRPRAVSSRVRLASHDRCRGRQPSTRRARVLSAPRSPPR